MPVEETFTEEEIVEDAHMLELHEERLKKLERKLSYLNMEIEGQEARHRELHKALAIFFIGAAYGVVLCIILNS